MRTSDVTIGDYVFVDIYGITSVGKINGIEGNGIDFCVVDTVSDIIEQKANIRPIPLTSDILEWSGFEKMSESPHKAEYRLEINDEDDLYLFVTLFKRSNCARIEFNPIGSVDARISFSKKDCAVHDLQHVMRMCGIEKEIIF